MDVKSTHSYPTQGYFDSFYDDESRHRSRAFSSNQSNLLLNNKQKTNIQMPENHRDIGPPDASNARYNHHSSNSSMKSNTLRSKQHQHHLRTAHLVKTVRGFGFTLADTPSGQMVRLTTEGDDPSGRGQLKSGDVIVAVGDADVRRETHLNVVSLLKSYPTGSTARISFIRPADGSRSHRRARSTVPESLYHGSVHSQSSSASNRPPFTQRTTSQNTEAAGREVHANGRRADGMLPPMGSKTPRAPSVLPRSSSLSYSPSEASKTHAVKVEERKDDGVHQQQGVEELMSTVALRKSLPAYELQRQYWTSLSTTNAGPNFSGTPDYIPASAYSSPSPNSGGEKRRRDKPFSSSSSSVEVRHLEDRSTLIADRLSDLNFKTDSTLTDNHSTRTSEVEFGRRKNSFSSEPNARSVKTKFFQKEGGRRSKRQQTKARSMDRNSSRSHQTSVSRCEESASVDQTTTSAGNRTLVYGNIGHDKGTLSPVDRLSPVYSLEIHRGSRGFGFSIRGGKEFRGMPLLVLNIAKGGPADMDGRMKNGDEILSINGFETKEMTHKRAIELIQSATSPISLTMKRTTDAAAAR